jgi:protein-disulfide isomerase/uncharacterized membrane protein
MISSAQDTRAHNPIRGRVLIFVILLLAMGGLGVSVELTRIHYLTHTDPSYHSICAVNAKINCESVAQSPFSVFAGLPISIWGLLAYTVIGVLALWGLITRRLHAHWPQGIMFATFTGAFLASAILAWISFFLINSMCIFCMSLYGINTALFAMGLIIARVSRVNPFTVLIVDLKAIFSRPVVLVIFALLGGGAVLGAELFVPPYWQHIGWKELPDLPTGVDEDGLHWIGAREPLVTVTEFSDYECPYCRRAHRNARGMTAKFSDSVRLIHQHTPLDKACNPDVKRVFHKRACEFAKAAECAAEQDKFWKMNDALFSIQDSVRTPDVNVNHLAARIGLDMTQFERCMGFERVMRIIRRDMKAAKKRKVKGTPTFFVNSQPYQGGFTENVLRRTVEAARERAAGGK